MEKLSPQGALIYWINERKKIRALKELGNPKPWTDNPVMQSVYFCNVHREDDKVTKWIRERWDYWYNGYDVDIPVVPNMCFARLVNRIESLSALGWPWEQFDPAAFMRIANLCSRRGDPFWGSAYVVTTHGQPITKLDYAVGVLEAAFSKAGIVVGCTTLKQAHKAVMQLEGFGSFMAAQVVADLKNTKGHKLQDAEDWWTWAAHGPGSLRGLSWYHEVDVTPGSFEGYIKLAWNEVKDQVPDMCMQDFQNCLCEYDKFMRVSNGTGKSKRKYDGA